MENNLIPPQNLPPFLKFCYTVGILPTSYKITWTYEEQVLECIRFIKEEIIPVVNKNALATTELQEKFVELVNYVETYLENLDLQEEVNNKLDEMVESGELQEIIGEYIPQNVLTKSDVQYKDINLHRLFRKISRTGSNSVDDDPTETYYAHLGGFERIDANTIVTCQISNTNTTDNMVLVQVVNITTGVVLRETELPLGHANGITYNPDNGRLYVAECYRYENGSRVDSGRIYQLNYGTLALENTIEYEHVLLSVAYDKITHKFYGRAGQTVYEIDLDNNTTVSTITLEGLANYQVGQSFAVYNNIIATIDSTPEIINVYDIEGNHLNCYSIPNYIDNSYGFGEAEDITLDANGNFYVGSENVGSQNGTFYWYNVSHGNFIKNVPILNYTNNYASFKQNRYVDNNNVSLNPTGSTTNPFNELAELEDYAHSPNASKYGIICNLINSTTPYEYCFLNSSKINVIIASPNVRESILGGLRIDNTNVSLLNLVLQNRNTFNTHHITTTGLSNVTIDSCTFEEEQSNTYCCEFYESSKCNFKGTLVFPENEGSIKLSDGAELETFKEKYDNIIVTSSNVKCKAYALKNGSYSGVDSHLNPNQCLQNNNINFENYYQLFKYINVIARCGDGKEHFKFETQNRNMAMILGNLVNDPTDTNVIIAEYTLQILADGYFNISSFKAVNVKTDAIASLTANDKIYDIYFSND